MWRICGLHYLYNQAAARLRNRTNRVLGIMILLLVAMLTLSRRPTIVSKDDQNTLLDLKEFAYIVNPRSICKPFVESPLPNPEGKNKLLILVHSSRQNFISRTIIRKTYGSVKVLPPNWKISLIFLLGLGQANESIKIETELRKEIQEDGDILMGNFVDTYRNLSYKHVMGYKWATRHCFTNFDYYLKSDDDSVVDIFHVIKFLQNIHTEYFYYCYVQDQIRPIRPGEKNGSYGKWEVSYKEFEEDVYPTYCGYAVYVTHMSTVKRVYDASKFVKILSIDDAFVTGVMRKYSNLRRHPRDTINLIPAVLFDIDFDKGNISEILDKEREKFLAFLIESRDPVQSCMVWRKLNEVHDLGNVNRMKTIVDCSWADHVSETLES